MAGGLSFRLTTDGHSDRLITSVGSHQNYFRDYDPAVGAYAESDPMGLKAGVGTYSYVSNNPLSHSDRFGLDDTVCMYDPAMCGMPPVPKPVAAIDPNTKARICALLKSCNGDPYCAYKQALGTRKFQMPNTWFDLQNREVENWLAVNTWPDGPQGYLPFINFYERDWKNIPFTYFNHTTPYNLDAWQTALEAYTHKYESAADLLKWCDSCGK
jgi:RHS repeat-associated protein